MRASILTPTFNSVEYVDRCIDNVQSQGECVFEHIIVDGGSTDGTIEKILERLRSISSLRYVPGPDKGQSDALNKGVVAAASDVIGVLNVDDSYEPNAVESACRVLAGMSPPAFVVGDCKIFESSATKWNRPRDLRLEALLLGYDYAQWPNNPSSYFYHKKVHDIVGLYDVADHYSMDLDFVFRCARSVETKYVPQHWGNFYVHPGCKTFEDVEGISRQNLLLERFRASLSQPEQRRMSRIKRSRGAVLHVKSLLKRSALLRRLHSSMAADK